MTMLIVIVRSLPKSELNCKSSHYGQVVSKFRASKYNMVVEKYQWKDLALQISKVGRFTQCLGTILKYLKH